MIERCLGTDRYSSLFLVGEGFDREWAKASIPVLCRNHCHVFYGNNLFAKGACYAAWEKVEEKNLKNYLFFWERTGSIFSCPGGDAGERVRNAAHADPGRAELV